MGPQWSLRWVSVLDFRFNVVLFALEMWFNGYSWVSVICAGNAASSPYLLECQVTAKNHLLKLKELWLHHRALREGMVGSAWL